MANINDAPDDPGPPQPALQPVDRRFYLRQDPPPDDPKLVPPQSQQPKPEPYIPSRTDRPYSQWGDPDFALTGARKYPGLSPGPFMPQIHDFPALIHAAVMGLGRFGSRYTGMPAIAMGTYATAYWNAYSQGMKERAAQSYQQYRQARQMTIDRGKDEMTAFRQVYAAYHDDKGNVTDPTAFSQALLATAKRFQNHSIINAVENGQIAMAERILQATDGQLNNLVKAQHQEERQKQLDEERRQQQKQLEEERRLRIEELKAKQRAREQENIERQKLGLPPISSIEDGGGASIASSTPDAGATASVPDTDTTDTPPDETTEPVVTASRDDIASDVSEEAPVTRGPETAGMAPTRLAQAQGQPQQGAQDPYQMPDANPTIDSWAKERIMGRSPKVPKFRDNAAEEAVSGRQAEYNKMLDKIEQDPSLNTREKINAALERAGLNEMRRQLDQYLDGKLTMSGRDKAKEPWSYLQRLGSKIGSDVTAETPEIRAAAMKNYARGGKMAQIFLALGTAIRHLDNFENLMGPNGKNIPSTLAKYPGQTRYIGQFFASEADRKKAAALTTEQLAVLDEVNKALVGGVGADRGRKAVESLGAWATTDPASVAQNVDTLHELLKERISELRTEFIGTTGGTASSFVGMFDKMLGDTYKENVAKENLKNLDAASQSDAPGKVIDYKDYFK